MVWTARRVKGVGEYARFSSERPAIGGKHARATVSVVFDREEIHLRKVRPTRGPPEVFTQEEYDVLADHADCEPATFCGRRLYVREGPALHPT